MGLLATDTLALPGRQLLFFTLTICGCDYSLTYIPETVAAATAVLALHAGPGRAGRHHGTGYQ